MSKESLKEREAQIREQYKDVPPAKMIAMIAGNGYKEAAEAKAAGEPVGWCASNFPQEILETLDIKVVYPENHAAAVAAKGGGERMCNVAEDEGYSNDICAYARISMAYTEETDIPELNMPQPDFVACCNNICNCMIKWYENLARDLDIPFIMIDVPYNNEYEAGEDRVAYLKGQFDVAIKQLEEISGKKWDQEKFEEVMEISDRTGRGWLDATAYSKYTPRPSTVSTFSTTWPLPFVQEVNWNPPSLSNAWLKNSTKKSKTVSPASRAKKNTASSSKVSLAGRTCATPTRAFKAPASTSSVPFMPTHSVMSMTTPEN